MIFNNHEKYEGTHAFLGASKFTWINWNEETLINRYYGQYAQAIGTAVHELARDCIRSRTKLSKTDRHIIDLHLYKNYIPKKAFDSEQILETLSLFVNDAIGFRMSTEVLLFYSENCYGTADAINYNEKDHVLRIHDLKTGTTPADEMQLKIYAALFYLEYKTFKPMNNSTIIRIYQGGTYYENIVDPAEIEKIMEIIKIQDNFIQMAKGVVVK